MSKVILLNGSAHRNGCTATALDEMIKVQNQQIFMSAEVLLYVVLYALCSVREEDNVVIADEIVLQQERHQQHESMLKPLRSCNDVMPAASDNMNVSGLNVLLPGGFSVQPGIC